jgi:hypothetical protein
MELQITLSGLTSGIDDIGAFLHLVYGSFVQIFHWATFARRP